MALIEISHLSVDRENRRVISDFSASCRSGTITAVIGANGSGKSTLLSAISGDLAIASGSITLDGRSLIELSLAEQASLRSVVSQEQLFWLAFTVRQVIEMGQDENSRTRIDQVMVDLEIAEIAGQSVLTLSGGQAQRVSIARALVRDTPIYLLDEPFASQDRAMTVKLIEIFRKMRDSGKTIVVIAHLGEVELDWCDQIIKDLA
jgi:ABC-type cobalamin/Fe3+-siderophores transport system ATPase subunit